MNKLKQSLRQIPYWAYLLVIFVISVNIVYIYYKGQIPVSGETENYYDGFYIIDQIEPGSAVDKTTIQLGDTIVSCNSYTLPDWYSSYHGQRAGDTLIFGILRNNVEVGIPVIVSSELENASVFFWTVFFIMILFNFGCLYILYKKPKDKAVILFFIYLQLFSVGVNSLVLPFSEWPSIIASNVFFISNSIMGAILIHFHLLFPRPAKIKVRFRLLPLLFYFFGSINFILISISHYKWVTTDLTDDSSMHMLLRIGLGWVTFLYIVAMGIALYQFITIKETLSRNQLRLVIIGSFFGFLTPIFLFIFYDYINQSNNFTYLVEVPQGVGSLIMICCLLIAIFRYRIWDIQFFFRKALLYLSATMVIVLTYLALLNLVDRLIHTETNFTRFIILSVSVLVFLILRDRIQKLVDRFFHRELYDSATVVSVFEEKLAGIYQLDELKTAIAKGLDEIFHFKSFIFNLKINGLAYEPAFASGTDVDKKKLKFEVDDEFEFKLQKSKVFSPKELLRQPEALDSIQADLIVPIISENKVKGFFICGEKQSEKTYSLQDIKVLSLLAKRVIALLHTASLNQKDLERQLMLGRERARISQDMHDDVGASLTRISILSELAKNKTEITGEARQWLGQINDMSRGVMEEMNQIIWALNPKNDTLEGLVSYLRRFAYEYLEPTLVNCAFALPEALPNRPLSAEIRRNTYLVVREALHNVVKHSGAANVHISAKMNEHGFKITIRDDGKGFDINGLEFPGNGLVNMKKRIADIQGEFQINTKKGEGTEIKLEIPLN